MSRFRMKLNELFVNEYGDSYKPVETQTFRTPYNEYNNNSTFFRSMSNYNSNVVGTQPSFMQKNSPNNLHQKTYSSVLDRSIIAPTFRDKPSFTYLGTDNNEMYKFRLHSSSKYRSRIKKEIDTMSKSFRDNVIPSVKVNRPIVALKGPEYENFSINYLTALSSMKNKKPQPKKNYMSTSLTKMFNKSKGETRDEISILSDLIKNRRKIKSY